MRVSKTGKRPEYLLVRAGFEQHPIGLARATLATKKRIEKIDVSLPCVEVSHRS